MYFPFIPGEAAVNMRAAGGPASAAGDKTCTGGLSAAAPLTSSSSSPLPPSSPSALRPPAPAQRKETLLSSSHRLRFVTGTLTVWLPVVKLCHSCCVSRTFSGLVFGSVHAFWTMAAVLWQTTASKRLELDVRPQLGGQDGTSFPDSGTGLKVSEQKTCPEAMDLF